ncbi:MAG: sulfatase [Rikenellaceae bacterium]
MKRFTLTTMMLGSLPVMASEKPNILLFIVDDMGWQDTSLPFDRSESQFNKIYHTPNMERLAERGVKFTSAYACSVSSPTRVSLMTGMNAPAHKVTNWTALKDTPTDEKSDVLTYPDWNVNGMTTSKDRSDFDSKAVYSMPLPEVLRDNGYYTIHCGKAHFGAKDTATADPMNIGFDLNIAGHFAGGLGSYYASQKYGGDVNGVKRINAVPGLEKYHDTDTFVTEALTLEAIDALDKRDKEKPFFLYMSHYAVHIPIMPDPRFVQKYLDRGMDSREAAYATLIEGMDKSLGDLLDYLDDEKLSENTIVIFFSDNGGYSATNARGGELHTHNAPLKSGKGSAHEGGIRVPMIVDWPGVTNSGSVCDDYMIVEDFYPTILEMAEADIPRNHQVVDGRSIVPMLTGNGKNPANGRALYWNYPHNWGPSGPGIGATCTIRQGDWKLIYCYQTGDKMLYDLAQDLGEEKNLAHCEPKIAARMSKQLGRYLRSVGAQRPSFKESGELCLWPDDKR